MNRGPVSHTLWNMIIMMMPIFSPLSRSREIGSLNYRIALKFDRHFGSTAADVPVKFQSDRSILNTNLVASRLCEILR